MHSVSCLFSRRLPASGSGQSCNVPQLDHLGAALQRDSLHCWNLRLVVLELAYAVGSIRCGRHIQSSFKVGMQRDAGFGLVSNGNTQENTAVQSSMLATSKVLHGTVDETVSSHTLCDGDAGALADAAAHPHPADVLWIERVGDVVLVDVPADREVFEC